MTLVCQPSQVQEDKRQLKRSPCRSSLLSRRPTVPLCVSLTSSTGNCLVHRRKGETRPRISGKQLDPGLNATLRLAHRFGQAVRHLLPPRTGDQGNRGRLCRDPVTVTLRQHRQRLSQIGGPEVGEFAQCLHLPLDTINLLVRGDALYPGRRQRIGPG